MSRSYQDFEPDCQYKEGEAQDIIEFQLKDFRKDQLRVHFGSNGVITVSGEWPLEGGKWTRFRKEFATPTHCNTAEIRARLSSGFLYITIPKTFASSHVSQPDSLPLMQQAAKVSPSSAFGESVTGAVTENVTSPMARPSRLKMQGKTAMKIGTCLIVAAVLFMVLFYVFKFYDPMIMKV
ncbi:hypothetical protein V6N13_015064 [Hibiscus sabdariffa]|uniref:SHSP domain-containing protein n=1 Tax=Hibiscus sabdariffa TaxID=183260 RepID=A0ABR2RXI4_9ROSI